MMSLDIGLLFWANLYLKHDSRSTSYYTSVVTNNHIMLTSLSVPCPREGQSRIDRYSTCSSATATVLGVKICTCCIITENWKILGSSSSRAVTVSLLQG